MQLTAVLPKPIPRVPNLAQNEPSVVEHSSMVVLAIVFGSVTMHLLAKLPMA